MTKNTLTNLGVTENFTSFLQEYFLPVSQNPFLLTFQATKVWFDSSQA